VDRHSDLQSDYLREKCGASVGYTAGRVMKKEFCSDSWMYRASGCQWIVEGQLGIQCEWLTGNCVGRNVCTARVAKKEIWRDISLYKASS